MIIRDTDVLSIVQRRQGGQYKRVVASIDALGDDAESKHMSLQLVGYQRLMELLVDFRSRKVLQFEATSADAFDDLRKRHRRHGSMDLKIAAIALANGATLATRNTSDFANIVGLTVVDPTK